MDANVDASAAVAARRFGTPAYVYDLDEVGGRYRALRAAIPDRFEIFYAVKANPCRAILHLLAREGAGADVASEGELAVARDAGIPAERLVVTGPAKSDALLAAAVDAGVAAIHVEGPHELVRIDALASAARRVQTVTLRLNPGWGIAERKRIIGGPGAHKFGMDLRTAERVLRERAALENVAIAGTQIFNASNVLDADLLAANAGKVLALARRLARKHGYPLRVVDFGGGLGIPYRDDEEPLDAARLGRLLARHASTVDRRTRLILEPGRFVVGPCGRYVTRVVEVKVTRGVRHVLVDGGVHHLLRPALFASPHRVRAVHPRPGKVTPACIGGPLCTSLDVLHPSAPLPPVEPGDLLAISDTGAYGYTESMPLFLSHPWPQEIGLRGGRARRLRRTPPVRALVAAQSV
ncbi:MAG: alanine racemase [Acidobacteriota bacterium]